MTDRNLYIQPKAMKNDRSQRDVKKHCAFHKDIGHNTKRCAALRDEIKRLMRAGHFKEFVNKPRTANRKERPRQQSPKKIREVLTIISGSYLAGESRSVRDKYTKEARTPPPPPLTQIQVHRTEKLSLCNESLRTLFPWNQMPDGYTIHMLMLW